jgi:hypothetical protein
MYANDLIKEGRSPEEAFEILRDTCNQMDRFVPNREIWSAIRDAQRRHMPPFFPRLYALICRHAEPSEIMQLVRRNHEDLLARSGPVWGPNGEKYLGPMSDEEMEDHARFVCQICIIMAEKYPERMGI